MRRTVAIFKNRPADIQSGTYSAMLLQSVRMIGNLRRLVQWGGVDG